MARTRKPAGQRPGKEIVEVSSSGSKRRRKPSVVESSESEEEPQQIEVVRQEEGEEEEVIGDDELPVWNTKIRRLSSFQSAFQLPMFQRKVNGSKQGISTLFVCERAIDLEEFGRFRVVECFKRLGWEANLTFNNDGDDRVCRDAIIEWMGTLKRVPGKKPPETMKLVGTINNKSVELSFAKIKKLAKFDSGAESKEPYEYPPNAKLAVKRANERDWGSMIRELFIVPDGTNVAHWPLKRENMQMLPKLLLIFLNQNVMPRLGDKGSVRLYEVMALHALLKGTPVLSACHLMMWGIWEAREKKDKFIISHSRFLTKLITKAGVLSQEAPSYIHKHEPYTYRTLMRANDWVYELRNRVHRLSYGRDGYLEAPREDVPVEEPAVYVPSFVDYVEVREVDHTREPVVTGFAAGMKGTPYYSYLQDEMVKARPERFDEWTECSRLMFDRQSQEIVESGVFRRSVMRSFEEHKNQEFMFNEQIRHEVDHERGYSFSVRPRPTDWAALPPYAQTHRLPRRAQSTPSEWVSPYQQQFDSGPSNFNSGGPFNDETVQRSLYESVFGQPYAKPSYDD